MPMPNPTPAFFPDSSSSNGVAAPAVVPGTTVLFTTMTWYDFFFFSRCRCSGWLPG